MMTKGKIRCLSVSIERRKEKVRENERKMERKKSSFLADA